MSEANGESKEVHSDVSDETKDQPTNETDVEQGRGCQVHSRTIYRGSVDIGDLVVDSGDNYCNWLSIVKGKLLQRETALLNERVNLMIEVVTSAHQTYCNQYSANNAAALAVMFDNAQRAWRAIRVTVLHDATQAVKSMLDAWSGVHSNKKIGMFRTYHQCCRRAFDEKKIKLLVDTFWSRILRQINQFAHNCALHDGQITSFSLRRAYANYLCISISRDLLETPMRAVNRRVIWLVPSSSYTLLFNIAVDKHRRDHKTTRDLCMRSVYAKFNAEQASFHTQAAATTANGQTALNN